jgi:diaminohydroxyphosphoribosylaminopyrimidine deaminase/5-amino-6-(5-phosphoribosylamino)uracil reductase
VKSTTDKKIKNHEPLMNRCVELAEKGKGFVSPNPLVGCVIVKNGKIVAEGYHKEFGAPHAEVNAINNALNKKVNLKGTTLYVNLEPCIHTGKTPPCADKIIEVKIGEVIIGIKDPNPLVSGKGINKLKKHRIKVTAGVLEDKCNELNNFYFKHIKTGLPYITLKAAQTLDGKIADTEGNSKWISSFESRKYVHKLRSEYDAVLVGRKTVGIDNPSLTVRHVKGRNPYRIVIDKDLVLNLQDNLFSDSYTDKTVIITSKEPDEFLLRVFEQRKIKFVTAKLKNEKIDLHDAMKKVAKLGIASVLVEGGAYTLTEFIEQKLADEMLIFISPKMMGTGLSLFRQGSQFDFSKAGELTCTTVEKDILLNIKLK